MKTLHAVMAWIASTRQDAPVLDDDADALLLRLHALDAQRHALAEAGQQRRSIALYGHSQASKGWLLKALCGRDEDALPVIAGEKRLDYFNHINPGHQASQMAIRFTREEAPSDEAFPLRLALLSEAELAQVFITHARFHGDCRPLDASEFSARLSGWQNLRQPQPPVGVTSADVATFARFWQRFMPSSHQTIDDTLWYQFADLLPSLDLNTRSRAWAMLWGDQHDLTEQWQTAVQALHLLGHRRCVHAPLSVLVDGFMLPAEGFLSPQGHSEQAVLVQTSPQNTVSITTSTLALLTLELVLNSEHSVLDDVDIIDIPVASPSLDTPLWMSKSRWLLNGFRHRLQPDLLLVCNAAAQRRAIAESARMLTQWAQATQPTQESSLPGLVWAITPQDDRYVHRCQYDEAIQQLVGLPGQRWGTLHAFDSSSLQRLIEWLSQATLPAARRQRIDALAQHQQQQLHALFSPLLSPANPQPAQIEPMIRELQSQAARHGELLDGLIPELQRFDALCQARQTREARVNGLFHTEVDLFARQDAAPALSDTRHDAGTQAWLLWCQHLRQWSRQDTTAQRFGLSAATLQQLAVSLITLGRRLDLPGQLRTAATQQHAGAAQLRAIIGNFIAWLGYASLPEADRPLSRIASGSAVFALPKNVTGTRLTRLGEQPVHAATRYVYDWLVALYTRAVEPADHDADHAVSAQARQALQTLLTRM